MCGITGFIINNDRGGVEYFERIINKMTEIIAHRGTGSSNVYIDETVALGHQRLAVLDLNKTGNQPMYSKCGRYLLVYDGRVYNFKEIKSEFEDSGINFTSNSDAEVILESIIRFGIETAIMKFNGIFAFVLYDLFDKKIYIARDRYGIKPLYFYKDEKNFIFGSEIKSIIKHPEVNKYLNLDAMDEYLTFQNFITNKTLFKNIELFPAAHFASFDIVKMTFDRFQKYWEYNFDSSKFNLSKEDTEGLLREKLEKAVKRQLIDDVEIGCLLGDKISSFGISYYANQNYKDLKTFSVRFAKSAIKNKKINLNEKDFADDLIYQLKTEHYEYLACSKDIEKNIDKIIYHTEEPKIGENYTIFCNSKLASNFVKICLSGTGGDEIFKGLSSKYTTEDGAQKNLNEYIKKYLKKLSGVFNKNEKNIIKFKSNFNPFETLEQKLNIKKLPANLDEYLNINFKLETETFLQRNILNEDKISMIYNLETRMPMFDNDLIDFAMQIPLKYRKINDENEILLNTFNFLPREIMCHKINPEIFDKIWLNTDLKDYVLSTLLNLNARIYQYLDYNMVSKIITDHFFKKQNREEVVWFLLYLERFLDIFFR